MVRPAGRVGERVPDQIGKQVELRQFALFRIAAFELVEMVGHNAASPIGWRRKLGRHCQRVGGAPS